jgi:hypothetical protein
MDYDKHLIKEVSNSTKINIVNDINEFFRKAGVKTEKLPKHTVPGELVFSGSVGVYWMPGGKDIHVNYPASYHRRNKFLKADLEEYLVFEAGMKLTKTVVGASNVVIEAKF